MLQNIAEGVSAVTGVAFFRSLVEHLARSLASSLWIDQTHVQQKGGDKVFNEEKETVKKLAELIKDKHSSIADAVLQGFINRIVKSDQLLAFVAIQEAIAASSKQAAPGT